MELNYKNRTFMVSKLTDLHNKSCGVVAIFEVVYYYILKDRTIKYVDFQEWEKAFEGNNETPLQNLLLVNYFFEEDEDINTITEKAKILIDNYDKKEGKIKKVLTHLENQLKKIDPCEGLAATLEENEEIQEDLFDIVDILNNEGKEER